MPVALYCWFVPGTMVAFDGAMLIETNWSCTARIVEPATELKDADMVLLPDPTLVARPCVPAALLIAATVVTEEVQDTELVMLDELPSV